VTRCSGVKISTCAQASVVATGNAEVAIEFSQRPSFSKPPAYVHASLKIALW